MKKVEFMKLNLQQENLLSKEERKILFGGNIGGSSCYVTCSFTGERPTSSCDYPLSYYCNGSGALYCICK